MKRCQCNKCKKIFDRMDLISFESSEIDFYLCLNCCEKLKIFIKGKKHDE